MTRFRSNMFKESFAGWVLLYQCGLAIKACLSDSGQQDALNQVPLYLSVLENPELEFTVSGVTWLFSLFIYIFYITLQIDQKAWQSRLYEDVLTPYVKVLFQTRYSRLLIVILLLQQSTCSDSFSTADYALQFFYYCRLRIAVLLL